MARSFVIPSIFTAIDKFTAPVEKMARKMGAFGREAETAQARIDRRFRKIDESASKVARQSFVVGTAIAAPLILAANAAVKFEDKMADVAKTTGLNGIELEKFGKDLRKVSGTTRTSLDDLLKIAEIGGQLGVAKNELLDFTQSVNKFNVALGSDFSGGVEEATAQIGKIKSLFQDTRNINIAESIQRAGSAINELGAQGAGTSANITDFTLRLGGLPDAVKPALTSVLALGTFLEESGINAEIGAGGLTKFLLDAGNSVGKFASQMGISRQAASALLAEDPTKFTLKFAESLNKLTPEKLAVTLKKLGIGSQESIKVLGALGKGTARLTELQKISNDSFQKATSLTDEYNKKNNTAAARLAIAKNNFQALAITIGEKLIPQINKLLERIIPIIEKVIAWTERNPELTKTILKITIGIGALAFAVSGAASAISLASKAMIAFNTVMAFTAANPIVAAIIALVAILTIGINKWNEFGAVLIAVLAPAFLFIVSLIQSFRRNWQGIINAFKGQGIIAGLKKIGATILDAFLMPLQQVFKLLSRIPGLGNFAVDKMVKIENLRKSLGADVEHDESGNLIDKKEFKVVSPTDERQKALTQKIENTQKQNVSIDIRDQTGRAKMQSDNNVVPIRLTSTLGFQ